MVRAVDAKTVGLGGDSEVAISVDGRLKIGPQRIVPVSLLAAHFPEVIASLAAQQADPDISSLAGKFILRPSGFKFGAGEDGELSAREREILSLVAKGFSVPEIGELLHISEHTVTTHVRHIYRKLEVTSRSQAIYEAVNLGLIDLKS